MSQDEQPTISEILRKHFTVIGGAMVISIHNLPDFIRDLHKWSRYRFEEKPGSTNTGESK